MSRINATAPALTIDEQPTKRLPTVTLFDLIAEARRMEAAVQALDEDRTVTIGAEENRRLIATARALEEANVQASAPHPADEEPTTLDAPAPAPPAQPPLELELEPRTLVMSRPPPRVEEPASAAVTVALTAAVSGVHPRITSEVLRDERDARDAQPVWFPKGTTETYVVAGIWAMALSLIGLLTFMMMSA